MKSKGVMGSRIVKFVVIAMLARTIAIDTNNEEQNSTDVELIKHIQEELDSLKREEALEKFKKVLGIRGDYREDNRIELPPQFMMELYNTVVDADGKTRMDNPYDAKIVRSFVEKDSSSKHIYTFNISGLEPNESILEAELHLYRKRSPQKSVHPSVLSSPYYIISVYQILPNKNLEEHDLHRLLNVHYVGAYASGWQIFNVKQAVLSWLSGSPNLGLLVTATTIFGDSVSVDFSRRSDQPSNKQPILVLFNQESNSIVQFPQESFYDEDEREMKKDLDKEENEMLDEERTRRKRHDHLGSRKRGQPEELPEPIQVHNQTYFRREKRGRRNKPRDENDIRYPLKVDGPRRKSFEQTLTSMDIYERALLRERLNSRMHEENKNKSKNHRHRHENEDTFRIRRDTSSGTPNSSSTVCRKIETEPCAKRELFVNFREIGLTEIIAPEGFAAYQCRGHCKSPLSQDQKPTNHATIQGIMNKISAAPNQEVEMPCCVPVGLSSISILYHDEDRDGVILKSYEDMVVTSCGCR